MFIPTERKYSQHHAWVHGPDDNQSTIGITQHAADQLGEILFVDFGKEVGDHVSAGDVVVAVESAENPTDIFSPITGTIVEINTSLVSEPGLINDDPYQDGWLFRVEAEDGHDSLMTAEDYGRFVSEESQ